MKLTMSATSAEVAGRMVSEAEMTVFGIYRGPEINTSLARHCFIVEAVKLAMFDFNNRSSKMNTPD